jgi:hypothetical protein
VCLSAFARVHACNGISAAPIHLSRTPIGRPILKPLPITRRIIDRGSTNYPITVESVIFYLIDAARMMPAMSKESTLTAPGPKLPRPGAGMYWDPPTR